METFMLEVLSRLLQFEASIVIPLAAAFVCVLCAAYLTDVIPPIRRPMSYPWYNFTVLFADGSVHDFTATGLTTGLAMAELIHDIEAHEQYADEPYHNVPVVAVQYTGCDTALYNPLADYPQAKVLLVPLAKPLIE